MIPPGPQTPPPMRRRMLWQHVLRRALDDCAWRWIASAHAGEVCDRAGVSVKRLRREARQRRETAHQ